MFLEQGVNSIVAASKVISRLQELADIVNKRNHPLTGSSRMSINMIQGGSKINVLPDTCVITIDRRLNPYENPEEAKKEIQNALDKLKREESKLDVELATRLTFPAVVSDSKAEIVRLLIETAHEITGLDVKAVGGAGSADNSFYVNTLGKPMGDYDASTAPSRAHAPNEFAKVSDLVSTAKIYALCMMRYLGTTQT
jgi:succinyl-diaminopimelate desuccinylase